ncbi:MAG: RNA methyltransferase [Rhodobacteraceae bacterium]|nr:RNA methyltransferase [Paracoccaceae bacterium]
MKSHRETKHKPKGIGTRKPAWVIAKEQMRKTAAAQSLWLFGLHAVRGALLNPAREKLRLVATANAARKLADAIAMSGMTAEICDARRFTAPLDAQSVHQGVALWVRPLRWPPLETLCAPPANPCAETAPPRILALDRVMDPHNVGAILRSAAFFGTRAVISPARHSPAETGALAKAASGALETQPYLRLRNLADALEQLRALGYLVAGLDGKATLTLADTMGEYQASPLVLVLGAEAAGLRHRTQQTCDRILRIGGARGGDSLNVSNAAAVALYEAGRRAHTTKQAPPP